MYLQLLLIIRLIEQNEIILIKLIIFTTPYPKSCFRDTRQTKKGVIFLSPKFIT